LRSGAFARFTSLAELATDSFLLLSAAQNYSFFEEISSKNSVFCAAGISCLFINIRGSTYKINFTFVRALAGATLRYCDLPQPVGAQRVRGFHFERTRARDANGLVTCVLNQPL
jgi:hypothetical protein